MLRLAEQCPSIQIKKKLSITQAALYWLLRVLVQEKLVFSRSALLG
jgi:hypothetical protein